MRVYVGVAVALVLMSGCGGAAAGQTVAGDQAAAVGYKIPAEGIPLWQGPFQLPVAGNISEPLCLNCPPSPEATARQAGKEQGEGGNAARREPRGDEEASGKTGGDSR